VQQGRRNYRPEVSSGTRILTARGLLGDLFDSLTHEGNSIQRVVQSCPRVAGHECIQRVLEFLPHPEGLIHDSVDDLLLRSPSFCGPLLGGPLTQCDRVKQRRGPLPELLAGILHAIEEPGVWLRPGSEFGVVQGCFRLLRQRELVEACLEVSRILRLVKVIPGVRLYLVRHLQWIEDGF